MAQVEHGCYTLIEADLENAKLERTITLANPVVVEVRIKRPNQKQAFPWPCELEGNTVTIPLLRRAHRAGQRQIRTDGPRPTKQAKRLQRRPKLPAGTIFIWTAYTAD